MKSSRKRSQGNASTINPDKAKKLNELIKNAVTDTSKIGIVIQQIKDINTLLGLNLSITQYNVLKSQSNSVNSYIEIIQQLINYAEVCGIIVDAEVKSTFEDIEIQAARLLARFEIIVENETPVQSEQFSSKSTAVRENQAAIRKLSIKTLSHVVTDGLLLPVIIKLKSQFDEDELTKYSDLKTIIDEQKTEAKVLEAVAEFHVWKIVHADLYAKFAAALALAKTINRIFASEKHIHKSKSSLPGCNITDEKIQEITKIGDMQRSSIDVMVSARIDQIRLENSKIESPRLSLESVYGIAMAPKKEPARKKSHGRERSLSQSSIPPLPKQPDMQSTSTAMIKKAIAEKKSPRTARQSMAPYLNKSTERDSIKTTKSEQPLKREHIRKRSISVPDFRTLSMIVTGPKR